MLPGSAAVTRAGPRYSLTSRGSTALAPPRGSSNESRLLTDFFTIVRSSGSDAPLGRHPGLGLQPINVGAPRRGEVRRCVHGLLLAHVVQVRPAQVGAGEVGPRDVAVREVGVARRHA